jgi:hypothetical protein
MLVKTTRGGLLALTLAALPLLSPPSLSARMILGGEPNLERVVKASDVICVAEVLGRESRMVNRRIETTYHLRVEETLAGTQTLRASGQDREFDMTVFGGAIERPLPIAQIYDGMVVLSQGQEVVLFLHGPLQSSGAAAQVRAAAAGDPGASMPTSAAATSMRPVYDDYGVYTLIRDPSTNDRHVTRINYEAAGVAITDEMNRRVLEAMERRANEPQSQALSEREYKLQLLEDARSRSVTQPVPEVLTAEGEVLPLPAPLGAPPRPAAATTAAPPAETGPAANVTALRTFEDFRAEIQDILAEPEEK